MKKIRMVADPLDGAEIVRQLRIYDKIELTEDEFGELDFIFDVSRLSIREAQEFLDEFNEIHEELALFIEWDRKIYFDYYVTSAILQDIQTLINKYSNSYYKGKLIRWRYGSGEINKTAH